MVGFLAPVRQLRIKHAFKWSHYTVALSRPRRDYLGVDRYTAEVKGLVKGPFGIRGAGANRYEYTVTHIPSGLPIGKAFRYSRNARRFVESLIGMDDVDWGHLPTPIPTALETRINASAQTLF